MRSQLIGEHTGERVDAGLGRRIGRGGALEQRHAGDRADVDDAAAALPLEDRNGGARAEEDGLEVQIHDRVPLVFGRFLDGELLPEPARAVHEDVEAAGLAADAIECGAHAAGVRRIARDEGGLATAAVDSFGRRLARCLVEVHHVDFRAGVPERVGGASADALRAAGDHDDLTREVEPRLAHCVTPYARPHNRVDASRAPSTSADSFAHAMLG